MKVVLKTSSVQGDLSTVPFHVGCQCAPTGREGKGVLPEKRPFGRHRGDIRAQFKRNQQRHHKAGGSSTIKYGFHRKQRDAKAARQHYLDHDTSFQFTRLQRIEDRHLTDMEVHEWWLNRPLSNDQVCVQADAIESAPQDFVESQEFVEMLEKTMPEGCNEHGEDRRKRNPCGHAGNEEDRFLLETQARQTRTHIHTHAHTHAKQSLSVPN